MAASDTGKESQTTAGGAADTGAPGAPEAVRVVPAGGDRLEAMVEMLSQINIFAGLPEAYLKRIAEIGTEETVDRNDTIFAEGDPGDKFFLILDGAVRISRMVPGMGEENLAVLRPGHYFGEMSLIDESPRSATALVHEACRLFVISKADLEDLLFVDRDLAYELLWNFVRTLTARLRASNDKMTFFATASKF